MNMNSKLKGLEQIPLLFFVKKSEIFPWYRNFDQDIKAQIDCEFGISEGTLFNKEKTFEWFSDLHLPYVIVQFPPTPFSEKMKSLFKEYTLSIHVKNQQTSEFHVDILKDNVPLVEEKFGVKPSRSEQLGPITRFFFDTDSATRRDVMRRIGYRYPQFKDPCDDMLSYNLYMPIFQQMVQPISQEQAPMPQMVLPPPQIQLQTSHVQSPQSVIQALESNNNNDDDDVEMEDRQEIETNKSDNLASPEDKRENGEDKREKGEDKREKGEDKREKGEDKRKEEEDNERKENQEVKERENLFLQMKELSNKAKNTQKKLQKIDEKILSRERKLKAISKLEEETSERENVRQTSLKYIKKRKTEIKDEREKLLGKRA